MRREASASSSNWRVLIQFLIGRLGQIYTFCLKSLTKKPLGQAESVVDQQRQELELQLFRNIQESQSITYINEDYKGYVMVALLLAATARKLINARYVMKNVSTLTQVKVALKQAMTSRIAMFLTVLPVFFSHVVTTDLKRNCFLLDQEHRAIGFMEPNTFYRLVIQAYGAQVRTFVNFLQLVNSFIGNRNGTIGQRNG